MSVAVSPLPWELSKLSMLTRGCVSAQHGTSCHAQVYEAKGGGYENQPGSKNEAKKGAPEPKDKAKKAASKKTGQVAPASLALSAPHCSTCYLQHLPIEFYCLTLAASA